MSSEARSQQHAGRIAVFHPDVSGCQSDGEPVARGLPRDSIRSQAGFLGGPDLRPVIGQIEFPAQSALNFSVTFSRPSFAHDQTQNNIRPGIARIGQLRLRAASPQGHHQ